MTARLSRRLTAALLALTILGAAFATGAVAVSHLDGSQNTAYLSVAHASPDAPPVDVYVDDSSALENVSFGDVSDYLELDAGTHTVTITAAGNRDAVVFEGDVTLERGTVTTVAASGEVSANGTTEFAPRAFSDDALTPDEGEAAVRVVHLSPDAPTVDVTAAGGDVVLAENVSFGNASNYVTVPAGNYEVEIRQDTQNANGTVIATTNVSVASGTAYTAWALGYASPADAPGDEPFEVALTEDATLTIELP
ncbi:MAG: DUF4397 domain-containing protein [Haloarculaceae archaeon]